MGQLFAAICLALAWLIPNHYLPWSSVYNEACIALALLLFAVCQGRRALTAPAPTAVWVVCGVAAIPLLQWSFGLLAFSGDAFVATLFLLGFASAIAVGHSAALASARGLASLLASAALVASVVSCFLALNQTLDVGGLQIWMAEMPPAGRAFANIAQPNNLATLLAFGAVGLWVLREQGRLSGGFAAFVLGLLVLGAGLTQSRSALLFGPFVAFAFWLHRRRGHAFKTPISAVLIATAAHGTITFVWPLLQSLMFLAPPMSLAQRGLHSGRLQMWWMLLEALRQAPWQGYGWLQIGKAELAVVNHLPPVGEMWLQGHNLFIELLIWDGIPLGTVLSSIVVYWFVSRGTRVTTVEAVGGYLTVCMLMIHGLFELPYHYAYFLIPAGLWIGLIEQSIGAPGRLTAPWNMAPQLLALALLVCIAKDYPAVEEDYRLVRFETLNIGNLRAAQPAPDAPFLSSLTAYLRFARTSPRAGMSDADLQRAKDVVQRYPYAFCLSRYAEMLALNGRLPEALEAVRSIRYMHDPAIYDNLRRGLQERVAAGAVGLAALAQAIPE